jgi:glutathione S-transferase
MSRKLYYVSGSIPNWRVLIALYEKGLEFEPCRLKVMQIRQTQSPEFLAINPRGQSRSNKLATR